MKLESVIIALDYPWVYFHAENRNQAVSKYDESVKCFHCSFDDGWKIFSDF